MDIYESEIADMRAILLEEVKDTKEDGEREAKPSYIFPSIKEDPVWGDGAWEPYPKAENIIQEEEQEAQQEKTEPMQYTSASLNPEVAPFIPGYARQENPEQPSTEIHVWEGQEDVEERRLEVGQSGAAMLMIIPQGPEVHIYIRSITVQENPRGEGIESEEANRAFRAEQREAEREDNGDKESHERAATSKEKGPGPASFQGSPPGFPVLPPSDFPALPPPRFPMLMRPPMQQDAGTMENRGGVGQAKPKEDEESSGAVEETEKKKPMSFPFPPPGYQLHPGHTRPHRAVSGVEQRRGLDKANIKKKEVQKPMKKDPQYRSYPYFHGMAPKTDKKKRSPAAIYAQGTRLMEFQEKLEVTRGLPRSRICEARDRAREVISAATGSPKEVCGMGKCIICLEKKSDTMFIPCGHSCTCEACGAQLKECPLCRQSIQSYRAEE